MTTSITRKDPKMKTSLFYPAAMLVVFAVPALAGPSLAPDGAQVTAETRIFQGCEVKRVTNGNYYNLVDPDCRFSGTSAGDDDRRRDPVEPEEPEEPVDPEDPTDPEEPGEPGDGGGEGPGDDNGHGNDDDHDDDSNPGKGGGQA